MIRIDVSCEHAKGIVDAHHVIIDTRVGSREQLLARFVKDAARRTGGGRCSCNRPKGSYIVSAVEGCGIGKKDGVEGFRGKVRTSGHGGIVAVGYGGDVSHYIIF